MPTVLFFFFKQKTAYEMRISDWSSDVCSSDLERPRAWPLDALFDDRRPADRLGIRRWQLDRKSVVQGKSVSVRVDLGGRRIIKKNTTNAYHILSYIIVY